VVLGIYQGKKHFLALLLGQRIVGHWGILSGQIVEERTARRLGRLIKLEVPPELLQRRPVTEKAPDGTLRYYNSTQPCQQKYPDPS
jgi:hypothetical protein